MKAARFHWALSKTPPIAPTLDTLLANPAHAFPKAWSAGRPSQLNPTGPPYDSRLQKSCFQGSCCLLRVPPYVNLKSAKREYWTLAKAPTTMMHSTWSPSKPPHDAGHRPPGWLVVLFEAALLSSCSSRLFQTSFIIGKRQHLVSQTTRSKLY